MHRAYLEEVRRNKDYLQFLTMMGRLSGLFSTSEVPYIHYRVAENLFCKCFNALNLSRFDDAYDAKLWDIGIGIKTFILPNPRGRTQQKVAEFDELAKNLATCSSEEKAQLVAAWRNDRIDTAQKSRAMKGESIYHIVGRSEGAIKLFIVGYDRIDLDRMRGIRETQTSLSFHDGRHNYSFNKAKSTLLQTFELPPPEAVITLPVEIDTDPYETLRRLLDHPLAKSVIKPSTTSPGFTVADGQKDSNPSVVLPLFSTKENGEVPARSGLNQCHAKGRVRDPNEVYIPVPSHIHRDNPEFFPARDVPFTLLLPNGTNLSAKICQDGRKALMSNPNSALGKWLLRDVLSIPVGVVVTRQMLDRHGFDSIIVIKIAEDTYRLELSREAHYQSYRNE